eukprot:gene12825-8955_t
MPRFLGGDDTPARRFADTVRPTHPGHPLRARPVSQANRTELGGLQWMEDNGIPDEFFTTEYADEYAESGKIFTSIGRDFVLYNDCDGLVGLTALSNVYFGPGISGTHETGYATDVLTAKPDHDAGFDAQGNAKPWTEQKASVFGKLGIEFTASIEDLDEQ